jgi:hypothetical protein
MSESKSSGSSAVDFFGTLIAAIWGGYYILLFIIQFITTLFQAIGVTFPSIR